MEWPRAEGYTSSKRSFATTFGTLHAEDAAGTLAIQLRNPAALGVRIEVRGISLRDFRHQPFELIVPVVLPLVQFAVPRNHPADIADAMRAQGDCRLGLLRRAEPLFLSPSSIP